MRIGLQTGYWSKRPPRGALAAIRIGEALGLDSVWTAEAYGSDAFTPLAWWGSRTRRVRLGTGIAQVAARTPTATAMQALTLDYLSGGRFVLGLGASGPQVVEGWYGQPYARPLARTREFVSIVRQVFAREAPVRNDDGAFYPLPLPATAPGATGLGRALKPTVHPLRPDIPIVLAAQGPKNVALAAEIADGWMAGFYPPGADADMRALLADGFARRSGALRQAGDFEVLATVAVAVRDSVAAAADALRPHIALYIGGMGAKQANFHKASLDRLGFAEVTDEVQRLYLAGDKAGAAAAVPLELVDAIAVVGTPDMVAAKVARWEGTAVDTLLVQGDPRSMLAVLAAAAHVGAASGPRPPGLRARAAVAHALTRFAPARMP